MKRFAWWLFLLFLLGCLIHSQVIFMMVPMYFHIKQSLASAWKEVVLALLALWGLVSLLLSAYRSQRQVSSILVIVLVFLAYCLIVFFTDDAGAVDRKLYGLRTFCEPFIAFFVGQTIGRTKERDVSLAKALVFFSVVICIWGAYQAYFLGDQFLMLLGYDHTENGQRLVDAFYSAGETFQRPCGTFSGPNEFAMWVVVALLLLWYLRKERQIAAYTYWLIFAVFFGCLLYSFSRSALLGWIVAMATQVQIRMTAKGYMLGLVAVGIAVVGLVIAVGVIDIYFPKVYNSLDQKLSSTMSLSDPSAKGHYDSFPKSVGLVEQNPLGLGLGRSGPRSALFGKLINSENSFFIVTFDLGIFGGILYLMCFGAMAGGFKRKAKFRQDGFSSIGYAILVGIMLIWFLLPLNTSLEVTMPTLAILGYALSSQREQKANLALTA